MRSLLALLLCAAALPARAAKEPPLLLLTCSEATHAKRSAELERLFDADQKDRDPIEGRAPLKGSFNAVMNRASRRDLKRRERVGEILGEGCIESADDYYHAAMVYQHGLVPDHYFLAYVFAARAAALGSRPARWLRGAALDRYLENLGYKQVYGTQAQSLDSSGDSCDCLWPVQEGLTDEERQAAGMQTLPERMEWLGGLNKGKKGCQPVFCPVAAKPVSRTTVPGVSW
ncbi:MAG: hypothetical protein KGL53_11595 [Elusimicrobia bacterium]|nr:hypothetical protein [Elusimicrobiota bacterium]